MNRSIFSIIFTVICSCTTKQSYDDYSQQTQKANLVLAAQLVFPIDSTIPLVAGNCNIYSSVENEYLLYKSSVGNNLWIFDVNQSRLVRKIHFNKQGPGAVPNPIACQMLSPDSIFVLSAYIKKINLLNWRGSLFTAYTLIDNKTLSSDWQSEPMPNFYLLDDLCIFETIPSVDDLNPIKYYSSFVGAIYNYKTNLLNFKLMKYPKIYLTGDLWSLYFNYVSIAANRKSIVFSFPLDKYIYVYNIQNRKTQSYLAQSDSFVENVKPHKRGTSDSQHFMENDAYNSIYYDKYRHVYYRFASLGIDLKAKRPLDHVLYKPVSVIILDEKFNKIGETKLPKNRYYFPNSFVGKEGLYISNSHPDNKQFSESNLSFSCYKLIENQNEKR